mgnify:FL=1
MSKPYAVHHLDSLTLAASLPPGSAHLLWCDIPYHGAIDAAWDNQWPTDAAFLAWVGEQCHAWRRLLAANGSLYVFCSPAMAWAVEGVVREWFEVLTNIRWSKPAHSTKAEMFVKEDLRSPFPASETILFCEQRGADSVALNRSGYAAKCDEARGFVFEPLRAYFDGERKRSGLSSAQIQEGMKARTGVRYTFDRHTFSRSQWEMPTPEQFAAARDLFDAEGAAEGRPYLRADYEALRADYEALRRPFFAVPERPYTDTWTFPTVQAYEGKHPCEKPPEMCRHALLTSTRPGDTVVDLYCGSGIMLAEAVALNRVAIGGDAAKEWADAAERRCEMARATGRTATRKMGEKVAANQGRLF